MNRMRLLLARFVAALFGTLLLISGPSGCHEMRPLIRAAPAEGEDLPILHQVHGVHSHETRPMQLVIRDTETLAQVPLADVPVNFSDQMLLIVTLGRVTSDQYSVSIKRIWREGGRLRVDVEVAAPESFERIAMASPYCIAVVPRCDLNIAGFSAKVPVRVRSWEQSTPPEKWGTPEKTGKPPQLDRERKK
jgi:hypothetical protein